MSTIQKDSILYELFVFAEWRPDPDFIRGEITPKRASGQSTLGYLVNFLKPEQTLMESISSYINQLQPWQMCLGDDGKVVAVLQDSVLEIRTKRGNYSTIVARAGVARDPYPQWRKMVWSPDCSMLAIAHSSGIVSFYDLMATNLFDIASDCPQPPEMKCIDTTHAVAGIIFLTSRVIDRKWSCEVLLVDHKGVLRSFFVSPTDGYIPNHTFTIEGGVSTVTYHTSHNIIFVTGLPTTQVKESTKAGDYGLRGWRILNDSPFYKLSITLDKEAPLSLTSWISAYNVPSWKKSQQTVITKAVPSTNGSLLACLHVNGSVSVWHLPNLRCFKIWPLQSQPKFDIQSPLLTNVKHKVWPALNNDFSEYSPIDINWWNSEAIILSRLNGSISICSTSDLHNMLGDSPEFLQGHPQISSTFDNGFLSLECEAMLISAKKLRRDSDATDESNSKLKEILDNEAAGDSSDDEKLARRSAEVIKTALYIVTDMERFQPKPKKLNLLSRVYRLLCLRSTTPEDLYSRKIENADFSEALTLAGAYNLDKDLVYQQQWRTSKVSHQSIKDYLGKISKKMWVIQQCCDRVPETLQAAKELLEFGLEITNEEILKDYEPKEGTESKMKNFLDNIVLDDLSTQKTEVLRYRHTMLFYSDRLEIYRTVIDSEYSTYSSDEYDRLRINSISKSAVELAREGRVRALTCLWPHISNIPVRLLVLQNLPETLQPTEYKSLLPTCDAKSTHLSKITVTKRETDWCEKDIFSSIWANNWSDDTGLYENGDGIESLLPSANLTDWYTNRAREIESRSGLPTYALALITQAQEGGVTGLETLKCLLVTLITLLYEVKVEDMGLIRLEGCSRFQVSNYLMSKSTEGSVIEDVRNVLFPYLERCVKLSDNPTLKESLFREYVVNIGKEDLTLPIIILKNAAELKLDTKQCMALANGCLMAQDSLKQLPLCFKIFDALSKESDASLVPSRFVKALDEMERFLNACALLDSHDVSVSFAELKTLSTNPKEVLSLMTKMSRNASNKVPNLTSAEWNELLADILDLHSKVFCCIDIELCYEIYASSLLSSANKINIQAARQVLTCHSITDSSSETHPILSNKLRPIHKINISQKVPFQRSVALILEAAKEYFDSASSISDVSLGYSWECLQLIKEENAEVQDEKDLISALKIIDEFELSILPIQVRLYTPKIGLIEDCLNSNNKAHKMVEKLLQLARFLRVSIDDEIKRKVMILSLCAEKAADNEDFDSVRSLCRQLLVTAGGGTAGAEGERAARRLGAEPRLAEPMMRRDLLNLALLHSHPQHIENLVQIRSYVEAEMLQYEMNNLVNLTSKFHVKQVNLQDSIESTDDDYVDALTSPLNENKGIMSATHVMEKYIQKPLLAFSDKNSWREALNMNWIHEKNEPDSTEEKLQCLEDSKIACHTFYSSLHDDCHISSFSTHYDKFTIPDVPDKQLVLLQALLRNNLLQDSFNYGCLETKVNGVLIQCAEHMLGEDTALFISQLLCASDHSAYKECLQNIPLDSTSINGVLYFYALLNYMEIYNLPDGSFFLLPAQLVSDMITTVEKAPGEHNNSKKDFLVCRDQYVELLEGEKLNQMGCDLDIRLFINDEVYRKNAIINLARTSNNDTFKKAMVLALKYHIDEQEIVLAHVSYILLNYSNLGFAESNTVISQPNLVSILKKNPDYAIERLRDDVWISIHGNDYQNLILYFNAISSISSSHVIHGLNGKDHVKLIKKVKSACSNLDYKFLIKSPQDNELVDNLLPYLTKDNIGLIAKLLRNLPPCLNIDFSTSSLYQQWLLKHFFEVPENMQSSKKWMQQYRECSSYFSKLKKEDLLLLTKEILFSEDGLQKLPANTRIQIANQTEEYCQHEQSNDESKSQMRGSSQEEQSNNWEDAGEEISNWAKFLELYHSDYIKYIIQSSEKNDQLWKDIESSRGVKSKMLEPLQMLLCDKSLSTRNFKILIETLSNDLLLDEVLLQALATRSLEKGMLISITKRVIDLKAENIVINESVLDKLKSYSTSALLSSKQRLGLMSLYKTESDFEDMKMLIQITLEIISSTWSEEDFEDVKDMDLADDSIRSSTYLKLLHKANTWNQLKVLVDLINMWPSSTFVNQKDNPCLCLIVKLLDSEQKIEDNIPLLNILLEKNTIMENDIKWIISAENTCHIIGKIWLCLLSKYESIHSALPSILSTEKALPDFDQHIDDNLISLILKKGLFTTIVKTILYPKCVQFLLRKEAINNIKQDDEDIHNQCSYTLNMAVNDLLNKKYLAEAGSLKLAAMGVPHTLKGFSQAIKIMKQQ